MNDVLLVYNCVGQTQDTTESESCSSSPPISTTASAESTSSTNSLSTNIGESTQPTATDSQSSSAQTTATERSDTTSDSDPDRNLSGQNGSKKRSDSTGVIAGAVVAVVVATLIVVAVVFVLLWFKRRRKSPGHAALETSSSRPSVTQSSDNVRYVTSAEVGEFDPYASVSFEEPPPSATGHANGAAAKPAPPPFSVVDKPALKPNPADTYSTVNLSLKRPKPKDDPNNKVYSNTGESAKEKVDFRKEDDYFEDVEYFRRPELPAKSHNPQPKTFKNQNGGDVVEYDLEMPLRSDISRDVGVGATTRVCQDSHGVQQGTVMQENEFYAGGDDAIPDVNKAISDNGDSQNGGQYSEVTQPGTRGLGGYEDVETYASVNDQSRVGFAALRNDVTSERADDSQVHSGIDTEEIQMIENEHYRT